MIKRIVKLTFQPDLVDTFITEVFDQSKDKIRAFPGCRSMELVRAIHTPNVLFTLSIWDSETALQQYRDSDLFKTTWAKTKVLFADKPEAWSVEVVD